MARRGSSARNKAIGAARRAPKAPVTPPAVPPPSSPPSGGSNLPAVIPPLTPPLQAEIALQKRQRKQRWTGLGKRSKIRAKAAVICGLRIQGKTTQEIADEMGLKPASIRQYMWIAGKNGWLTTQDPHDIAEFNLTHRVVSNLEELLHARNYATGLPDKEVTLESAKGLGVFKDHSKPEALVNAQQNMLTINVVMTGDGPKPEVRPGTGGGIPAYMEGDLVGAKS